MNKLYAQIIEDLEREDIPITHHGIVMMLLSLLDTKLDELEKRLDATNDRITAYIGKFERYLS